MSAARDSLEQICEQYQLALLVAFGSRAKEALRLVEEDVPLEVKPNDLDIGVLPLQPLSARQKVTLALALEDLFMVSRVDLVVIPEAKTFLAANIIRGECLYARNQRQADEYELYILRRAGDLAPFERERIGLILSKKE